jgi:hypothetical protein
MFIFNREWFLTPQRMAIHVPTNTAVVADVHLGYDMTRQSLGDAIPAISLADFLAPMKCCLMDYSISNLVIAGDWIEKTCPEKILTGFISLLRNAGVEKISLIRGNHDRQIPAHLSGLEDVEGIHLGTWQIHHGDKPCDLQRTVFGHYHPCTFFRGRKTPCYLVGPDYLMLPAYSPDAAGVNLDKEPCWSKCQRYVITNSQVLKKTNPRTKVRGFAQFKTGYQYRMRQKS